MKKQIFYIISCVSGDASLILCARSRDYADPGGKEVIEMHDIRDTLEKVSSVGVVNPVNPAVPDDMRSQVQDILGEDWHVCSYEEVMQSLSDAWVNGTLTPDDLSVTGLDRAAKIALIEAHGFDEMTEWNLVESFDSHTPGLKLVIGVNQCGMCNHLVTLNEATGNRTHTPLTKVNESDLDTIIKMIQ